MHQPDTLDDGSPQASVAVGMDCGLSRHNSQHSKGMVQVGFRPWPDSGLPMCGCVEPAIRPCRQTVWVRKSDGADGFAAKGDRGFSSLSTHHMSAIRNCTALCFSGWKRGRPCRRRWPFAKIRLSCIGRGCLGDGSALYGRRAFPESGKTQSLQNLTGFADLLNVDNSVVWWSTGRRHHGVHR